MLHQTLVRRLFCLFPRLWCITNAGPAGVLLTLHGYVDPKLRDSIRQVKYPLSLSGWENGQGVVSIHSSKGKVDFIQRLRSDVGISVPSWEHFPVVSALMTTELLYNDSPVRCSASSLRLRNTVTDGRGCMINSPEATPITIHCLRGR